MKTTFIQLLVISMLAACGGNSGSADKIAKLNELKKQQAELKEQITALEAEIAAGDSTGANVKSKLVAATEIAPVNFNHYIEVQARVEGDEDVTVSAETMGTITSILVQAGARVSKGQVMATIDDRIIRQGIAEVEAQLELATQLYDRQRNLWQQKIGSEVQYLQAKTSKEALEKRMASMNEQLSMTRIKSPIDGTVDLVMIKTGQSVAPGVPAIRVVNLNALKVTGEVAESYISKVNTGNDVIIYFPDLSKEIKTKLDYSGKAINRLNRTFNVEVRIDESNGEYRPNMTAVLKIVDYNSPKAFVLPIGAVQKSSDGEFVYVATEEAGKTVAKRKTVTSGIIYNGVTEITSGLSEGDKVITTGYQGIIEGDIIRL